MRTSERSVDELPEVCTVREVAECLGVAENTVYSAIRRGELPAVHIGRRIVVSRHALWRWLTGEIGPAATLGEGR